MNKSVQHEGPDGAENDVKNVENILSFDHGQPYPPPPSYLSPAVEFAVPHQQQQERPAQRRPPTPYPPSQPYSSLCPPQPHHDLPPSRVLHVSFSNWKYTQLRISEQSSPPEPVPRSSPSSYPNVTAPIPSLPSTLPPYTATSHLRRPHLRFKRTSPHSSATSEIATATFHNFRSKISISLHGQPITLKAPSRSPKNTTTYASPTLSRRGFANTTITWRSRSRLKNFDIECLSPGAGPGGAPGAPLAQFRASYWSMRKAGKMEFFGEQFRGDGGGGCGDGEILEEILVVGLALVQWEIVMNAAGV